MSIDQVQSGISALQRAVVYAQVGLSEAQCHTLETLVAESGQRKVGKGALTNVRVRHQSKKNGTTQVLESHTCELIFAYLLEMDPAVLGFYVQVPCRRIEWQMEHGRTFVSTATLDVLVFWRDRIELVECKHESWLQRESQRADTPWVHEGEEWTHRPYAAWAQRQGIVFRAWTAPNAPGTHLQNLEACYAVRDDVLEPSAVTAVQRALVQLKSEPATIEQLQQTIPGFSPRLALWMLSQGIAFGPWASTSLSMPDRFRLYSEQAPAKLVDAVCLEAIRKHQRQCEASDPVLTASNTDLAKGRQRLQRVVDMAAGTIVPTYRLRRLAQDVHEAVERGESALSACITRYARSGNRTPRLLPEHEQMVASVIAEHWNRGTVSRPIDLFNVYKAECRRRGLEPTGRERLDQARRRESPLRHALVTGGFRAYHSVRPSTDPRTRSQAPLGYGTTLHIDSSIFDNFSAPNVIRNFPAAKATFYVGVDGATRNVMATALMFGPARTDGLALLIRDYVRRNGFLPRLIHVDRGAENQSNWLTEFCEGRISLRDSPTAGSAWNGLAENMIKQINDQVAHRLPGSSRPDQKGRRVDGRFKGRQNARIAFVDALGWFNAFAYGDLPNTPGPDDRTPLERKEELIATYGIMGTPCDWNENFMIQTSIRVRRKRNVHHQRGIRTVDGYFSSDELIQALRTGQVQDMRRDCCYPELMRVQIKGQWIKAFHSSVQSISMLSDDEKLFELLYAAVTRIKARKRRETLGEDRFTRMRHAEAARPAIGHLALPMAEEMPPDPEPASAKAEDADVPSVWLPFEESDGDQA